MRDIWNRPWAFTDSHLWAEEEAEGFSPCYISAVAMVGVDQSFDFHNFRDQIVLRVASLIVIKIFLNAAG